MNNVIKFPHFGVEKPYPENMEELENKTEMFKKIYLEELSIQLFEEAMSRIMSFNLVNVKDNPEDIGLLFETFKAVLYRKADLQHDLHDVAETLYKNYRYAMEEEYPVDEYDDEDE